MNLTLERYKKVTGRTFGKLYADGQWLEVYTLEDEVREVPGQPVSAWKVPGKTAIPKGVYRITLENSPRFGPGTLTVNAVMGFVGVRMHAGNTEADTEGCPLLGFQVNDSGIVGGTSRGAVALVKRIVQDAIDRGEIVTMEVLDA